MAFRIGVHLGDVIVEGDDLYGDGVNIAARLEGIAEGGGVCIPRQAYDQVQNKLALGYRSLGPQNLKNIPEPVEAFAIQGDGSAISDERQENSLLPYDGRRAACLCVQRARSSFGEDRQLAQHLEYDMRRKSDLASFLCRAFARAQADTLRPARHRPFRLGRCRASLDAWVNDVAAVVDAAAVERFPLLGYSQGCAGYGCLCGAPSGARLALDSLRRLCAWRAQAFRRRPREAASDDHIDAARWGADNPALRQMFAAKMMPDATKEQVESFNEMQQKTTSAEGAARYYATTGAIDVCDLLARVRAPTLVTPCARRRASTV